METHFLGLYVFFSCINNSYVNNHHTVSVGGWEGFLVCFFGGLHFYFVNDNKFALIKLPQKKMPFTESTFFRGDSNLS